MIDEKPPIGDDDPTDTHPAVELNDLTSRFRKALEAQHQGDSSGRDPYDTPGPEKADVWRSKRKRA